MHGPLNVKDLYPHHTIFPIAVYTCSHITTFNNLPSDIQNTPDGLKTLQRALKHFLTIHSLYTLYNTAIDDTCG